MGDTWSDNIALANFSRYSKSGGFSKVVGQTTEQLDWLAHRPFKALSPAVQGFPGVFDAIKCIVTTCSKEFSLHISSEPCSACVACSCYWPSNALLWCPYNLATDLIEIYGVVFNVTANGVLSIPRSTKLVSDNYLFLLIVLKFELNREHINKILPRCYNWTFRLTFSQN